MDDSSEKGHHHWAGTTNNTGTPVGPGCLAALTRGTGHQKQKWQWPGAAVIRSTRDHVLPHQNYICVKSSGCQRVCDRSSKGLCCLSPLPGYFTGVHSAQTKNRNWWNSKLNPLPHQSDLGQHCLIREKQCESSKMRADVSHCFAMPLGPGIRILAANCPQAVLEEGEQDACSWGLEVQQGALRVSASKEGPRGSWRKGAVNTVGMT